MVKNSGVTNYFILLNEAANVVMFRDGYEYPLIAHETLPGTNIHSPKSTSPAHLNQMAVVLPGKLGKEI